MKPNHLGLLLRVLILTGGALLAGNAGAQLKVGDLLPDLSAYKLEGKLPEAWKGKIVMVDFWASWCGPCAISFPVLEELHQRYKDQGVQVIGVSVDETPRKAELFLKKHPVSFPVVRDAEQRLVALANVESMPTSYLVDGSGKIRFIHHGFHGEETKQAYIQELESLLHPHP